MDRSTLRRARWLAAAALLALAPACGGGGDGPAASTVRVDRVAFASVPAVVAAGEPFDVVLMLLDETGAPIPETGTIAWLKAVPPLTKFLGPSSAGTAAGIATFTGLRVTTVGTGYRFEAKASGAPALWSDPFDVVPGPVASFRVTRGGATVAVGVPTGIRVQALDAHGNPATNYAGTVHVTSSDIGAVLPADAAFQPADQGARDFDVAFSQPGTFVVTATDVANPSARGQISVPVVRGWPVLNEVFYDSLSTDGPNVFVELYGVPGVDLSRMTLVAMDGLTGNPYDEIPLVGAMSPDGFYIVATTVANANLLAVADLLDDAIDIQNGPDGIRLYYDYGLATEVLVDNLVYGTTATNISTEGPAAPDVSPGRSLARIPDGRDTDNNLADFFALTAPTPGATNGP